MYASEPGGSAQPPPHGRYDTKSFPADRREAARVYARAGLWAVPIPPRSKGSDGMPSGWPRLRIEEAEVETHFAGDGNVGMLLGANQLMDLDLDSREAELAAGRYFPHRRNTCGRLSKKWSHYFFWYDLDDPPTGGELKFRDPVRVAELQDPTRKQEFKDAGVDLEHYPLLLELRSGDRMTVVPPSVHPCGERLYWREFDEEPVRCGFTKLKAQAGEMAAAALIGRYWPDGSRHDASGPLAGGLLRLPGWTVERAEKFVAAALAAAGDDAVANRLEFVRDTAEKLKAGKDCTGWPKFATYLGRHAEVIVRQVQEWLDPERTNSAYSAICAWGDPVPLDSAPEVPDYPIEVLPTWLREWAEAVAIELQVPVDLPAALGLGLVAAGVARKIVVRPRPGFTEPVNQFVMAALPPGDRKSQAFRRAIIPVQELQREAREAMKSVIQEKESEFRIAEGRVKHLEGKIAKAEPGEREMMQEELKEARKELLLVEVPPTPLYYTEDDTAESLKLELVRQAGRMMVATTEAKCLENITLYSDRPNFDVYLKGHAGDEICSGRIGRGRDSVNDPALSCLLSPQPALLRGLAENEVLRGRGFLARWFYQLPSSRVGSRRVGTPAVPTATLDRYSRLMRAAWTTGYAADEFGAPIPYVLTFDAEAAAAFEEFERRLESQLGPGQPLARLAGWGNKLNGACARLAAALHVAEGLADGRGWNTPIPAATIGRAIRLCRDYYTPHAVAAFDLMGANEVVTGARRVWQWVVKEKRTFFPKRDAFNANRAAFDTVDQIQPCLDLLERHYLIRQRQPDSLRARGRPSSPIYDVNPGAPTSTQVPIPDTDGPTPEPEKLHDGPPAHKTHKSHKSTAEPSEGISADSAICARGGPTPKSADVSPPAPAPVSFTYVTDAIGLTALVAAVERYVEPVGLDTETTGLDSRTDRARLLQISTGGEVYVVDLFAVARKQLGRQALAELFEVLADLEIVGHNLAFDLRFLAPLGFVPGKVWDTMLGSQVLYAGARDAGNAPYRHGLADCVERELGGVLDKGERLSDWSAEKLTDDQLWYAATDVRFLIPLADALRAKLSAMGLSDTAALEMRALPGIAWAKPVKVDAAAWGAIAETAEAERAALVEEMQTLAPNTAGLPGMGCWNWESPNDVKAAFASVGETVASTADDVLATIDHPLADLIRRHRAAGKRTGTYGRKWVEEHVVNGTVLPRWNQVGAASGRMSCSDPNLQQIPREVAYRKCFIARPGHVLVKADYSQIELRIAAKIAGEEKMIEAYKAGRDLHALTAAAILKKELSDVAKPDRQLAKAVNFGLLFGMGWRALKSYALTNYGVNLTDDQAKRYRSAFFKAYPGLSTWHGRTGDHVDRLFRHKPDTTHEVRTLGGRRRLVGVSKQRADGERYPNLTDALNTPVQGSAADGMKAAVALLWERRADCPNAIPVLFVHDEIVIEAPEPEAETVSAWLRSAMLDGMAPLIDPVPVEVEVTYGRTWGGD